MSCERGILWQPGTTVSNMVTNPKLRGWDGPARHVQAEHSTVQADQPSPTKCWLCLADIISVCLGISMDFHCRCQGYEVIGSIGPFCPRSLYLYPREAEPATFIASALSGTIGCKAWTRRGTFSKSYER